MASLNLHTRFGRFVSPLKIPFPGNGRLRFEETRFEGALLPTLTDRTPPKLNDSFAHGSWCSSGVGGRTPFFRPCVPVSRSRRLAELQDPHDANRFAHKWSGLGGGFDCRLGQLHQLRVLQVL